MSMTLRKQLSLEQTDSRRLREALLATLNSEVVWTDWLKVDSRWSSTPYFTREGKAGNMVLHHTRYTAASQAGGAAGKPRSNGYWENIRVERLHEANVENVASGKVVA